MKRIKSITLTLIFGTGWSFAGEFPCRQVAIDAAILDIEAHQPQTVQVDLLKNVLKTSSVGKEKWYLKFWIKSIDRYKCYQVTLNSNSCGVESLDNLNCD